MSSKKTPSTVNNELSTKLSAKLNATIEQNINYLMLKRKLDTATLSAKTKIAPSTINALRRGCGNPTLHTLSTLANFFNVTIHSLIEKDLLSINVSHFHEIPLISINEVEIFLSNNTHFKNNLSVELPLNAEPQRFFGMKIENNSFAPVFNQNTTFVVFKGDKCNDGDIALVKFGDHPACLRQVFIGGKIYSFKIITNAFDKEVAKSSDFCILGVVTKVIQSFNENIYL